MEELPIDLLHEMLPEFVRMPARAIACTIAEVNTKTIFLDTLQFQYIQYSVGIVCFQIRYYHRVDKKVGRNVPHLRLLHAAVMNVFKQRSSNQPVLNGQCTLFNFAYQKHRRYRILNS